MKKKETFLELHERLLKGGVIWIDDYGDIIKSGLCAILSRSNSDYYLHSTFDEYFGVLRDFPCHELGPIGQYTAERQNIILFCASINGEL